MNTYERKTHQYLWPMARCCHVMKRTACDGLWWCIYIHGPCFACKIRDRTNEVDRSILLCYVEWVKILWRIGTLAAWEKIPPEKWDCMCSLGLLICIRIDLKWFKLLNIIWMQDTATTPLISHVWFRASDFLNQEFVHESWIFKMLPFLYTLQIPHPQTFTFCKTSKDHSGISSPGTKKGQTLLWGHRHFSSLIGGLR